MLRLQGGVKTGWKKKEILIWCDEHGEGIKKKDLNKMKRSGKAFLKVVGVNRLPTAYELTGDDRWDVGGELYQMYDLGLDSGEGVLSAGNGDEVDLNTVDESEKVENNRDDVVDDGCVKVLDEKAYDEAVKKKKESRLKQVQEDGVFENSESLELFQEFSEILTPYVPRENFHV